MKKSLGARTLTSPTPVWLIGTYDKEGKPNLMTAAWVGICCSQPPCVCVSLRKTTYTYGNIVERKAFTVNIPGEANVEKSDYIGTATGKSIDKFSKSKLTAVRSSVVNAPYVQEFPLIVECRVIQTIEIGLHTEFVGEIMDVKADSSVLNDRGLPDVAKIKPFLFDPANGAYYSVGAYLRQAFSTGKSTR
ncbi:MAG TPA: flavin reductase family protein [Candidatus Bathyarchaeia archaeon]|nr:flavin reductase family protein [Candidatus Bathyarchaeia archaeon]